MKRTIIGLIVVSLLTVSALGQTGAPAAAKRTKKEGEIHAALKRWAAAMVSRDTKELDALYADDLFVIGFNGGTRGKKEELSVLAPSANLKTLSVENEDIRIRDYGKTAAVTALVRMKFAADGKESGIAMRYTAVFVRTQGRWRISVLQTTRVQQEGTASRLIDQCDGKAEPFRTALRQSREKESSKGL